MAIHDQLEPHAVPGTGPVPARDRAPAADVARSMEDPGNASPGAVLELQRLAGNAVVSRMLAQDAQRESGGDEAAEGTAGRSPILDVVGKGGGRPLDVGIRREMEGALGADFSNVRVHTDARATESARAVNANAYTVGNDVVIRNDRWAPDSGEGKKTIAHELTHVIQQQSGPVAGRDTGNGIRLSDPSDEFERAADVTADAVVSGAAAGPAMAPSAGAQRERIDREEDTIQGEFVQRTGEEEDEGEEIVATQVDAQAESAQRQEIPEEEEEESRQLQSAQGQFVQRQEIPEEEMAEEEGQLQSAQGQFVQRQEIPEEEMEP